MHISKQFIKPFPAYEEVFYDNLELHKKHFLPICPINLQCIEPEWDEWLHIVSAKEIHEDCVNEEEIFDYTNLLYVPKDEYGHPFTYVGFVTGYYFQAYGADRVYLFFNKELRKAVICLEYT
ncbi:hypothetical protein CON38_12065 [Bacillus cereus]|nr:hypothetical protein ICU_03051 [Bacillus cereus BAG2X1-1]PEA09359.1 hypothetical protein CON38_12065 [Bacillus cereus]